MPGYKVQALGGGRSRKKPALKCKLAFRPPLPPPSPQPPSPQPGPQPPSPLMARAQAPTMTGVLFFCLHFPPLSFPLQHSPESTMAAASHHIVPSAMITATALVWPSRAVQQLRSRSWACGGEPTMPCRRTPSPPPPLAATDRLATPSLPSATPPCPPPPRKPTNPIPHDPTTKPHTHAVNQISNARKSPSAVTVQ
jgi:hypothetical protein